MGRFRFDINQHIRVITHPARPPGIVVARWTGDELKDPYGENLYEVSSFVTKQRESSLAALAPEDARGNAVSDDGPR